MGVEEKFTGFPKGAVKFYRDLKKDNSRAYFEKSRGIFESQVMDPSRRFVVELGKRLGKISFGIHAEPRTDKSIFRIYRDSRFSKDKTPYKTHLALWFWDGDGRRMECPGYYFQMEPGRLMLGSGLYMFPDYMLKGYRDTVADGKYGDELHKIIAGILKKEGYYIGGSHYKKVPRGYDGNYRNSGYLLYNGLYAGIESPLPDELYSEAIVDYCCERFKAMFPLHKWLYEMIERIR